MKRLVAACLLAAVPSAASAAITVTFNEVGNDVVALTSGSFDLTGMTFGGPNPVTAGINQDKRFFDAVTANEEQAVVYFGAVSGPFFPSFAGSVSASSFSGDVFGVRWETGRVTVPLGYVSGSSLSATTTWANHSFSSLGLPIGTYVYTFPADTVTLQIGAVPEPATWAMFILGFGMIGASMRRRKGVSAQVSLG